MSLDHLALLAGLKRPDVRRDPVHFKLVIASATSHATQRVRPKKAI